VRRLQGCLGALPRQMRLVLQLRAGIGGARALTPAGAARALHISVARALRLERRALRRLNLAARAGGCGRTLESSPAVSTISDFGPIASGSEAASGGVSAARYVNQPTPTRVPATRKHGVTGGRDLLGAKVPPEAGQALQVALIVLAGILLAGVLFAKELQLAARYRNWLSRLMHKPPS
jgi:hypothetical protein